MTNISTDTGPVKGLPWLPNHPDQDITCQPGREIARLADALNRVERGYWGGWATDEELDAAIDAYESHIDLILADYQTCLEAKPLDDVEPPMDGMPLREACKRARAEYEAMRGVRSYREQADARAILNHAVITYNVNRARYFKAAAANKLRRRRESSCFVVPPLLKG